MQQGVEGKDKVPTLQTCQQRDEQHDFVISSLFQILPYINLILQSRWPS